MKFYNNFSALLLHRILLLYGIVMWIINAMKGLVKPMSEVLS